MRFFLIDRVDEISPGKYAEGVKCITMTDDIFDQHFPNYPIFPGSLILEGLAQLSGILLEFTLIHRKLHHKRAGLSMVNRMKFRKIVVPGDRLTYRAEIKMFYPDEYAVVKVRATDGEEVYAEGELVHIFLDIINDEMKRDTEVLMQKALNEVKIVL